MKSYISQHPIVLASVLFCSILCSSCASSDFKFEAVTDGELILYFSEPFNVTIETVADEIVRAGMGISNAGLLDQATYQILVVEEQRLAIGGSNTSNEPITVGTAELRFRLNQANNVEMKMTFDTVDKRGGNTESRIGTGEFARFLKKRLDSRLTIVSGDTPTWN